MYIRIRPQGNEKRRHVDITMYPGTVHRIDAIRGEFSRSSVIESLLLEFLDIIEGKTEQEGTLTLRLNTEEL